MGYRISNGDRRDWPFRAEFGRKASCERSRSSVTKVTARLALQVTCSIAIFQEPREDTRNALIKSKCCFWSPLLRCRSTPYVVQGSQVVSSASENGKHENRAPLQPDTDE